jgi:hypothetical protein
VFALLLTGLSGCGYGGPTNPGPGGPTRYDGEWSGTTSQGQPISFTVSANQVVTSLTIGFNFSGCSGVHTVPNANLPIGTAPVSGTGFGYGSGAPDGPNYTQVYGTFSSSTTATGSMIFGGYAGCGNSGGIWNAAKR